MHREIKVEVKKKVATAPTDAVIVCGNSDYTIVFQFDDEWDGRVAKTARFKYFTDAGHKHIDVPFTGDSVEVPVLANTRKVEVGVFAGDLASTTGATFRCEPCIRCGSDAPAAPESNVYDEIMESINSGALQGPPGDDGDSAYQVAVNNGFEGTEQEWLESLKGSSEGEGAAPAPEMLEAVVDFNEAVVQADQVNTIIFESSLLPNNARVCKIEIPDVANDTEEYIQLEDMVAKDPNGLGAPYFILYPKNTQGSFYTVAAMVVFPTATNDFYDAVGKMLFMDKTIKIYYRLEN
jgi:hypothetical protein